MKQMLVSIHPGESITSRSHFENELPNECDVSAPMVEKANVVDVVLRRLLGPDDWLGKNQPLCLMLLALTLVLGGSF